MPHPRFRFRPNHILSSIVTWVLCLTLLVACTNQEPQSPPPDSWHKYTGDKFSIFLPPTYEEIESADDIAAYFEQIEDDYKSDSVLQQQIQELRFNVVFWAKDNADTESSCGSFMYILPSPPQPQFVSLDEKMLSNVVTQLADSYKHQGITVTDHRLVPLGNVFAGRLILSRDGVCRTSALYMVAWGKRYWTLAFSAKTAEFDRLLPSFDQSVQSFLVQSDD